MSNLKQELESLRIERDRPAGRGWRWIVLVCVAAVLIAAVVYELRTRPGLALGAIEVETVRASLRSTDAPAGTPLLTASGYVVARRKAVVSAKIQGRLAELRVEEGSYVREGEIVARLESADYEAQIVRAKAQIQRAEADLAEAQRQSRIAQGLAQENVYSRDQLDAAHSRVSIAEAALAQARADLQLQQALYDFTLIRAPFTGVVVKKMAEVGESVAPIPPGVNISTSSGAIVALADLATLEVEADVNESNVAKLASQQPAEVVVQAFPERRYRAALRQIIPTADRTKATVMAKVTILDKDKDLKPEMSANVTFLEKARPSAGKAKAAPAVFVPRDAVLVREGKSVVFQVDGGRVRERIVTTGGERQGEVAVTQGLTGSETLVSRPPETLRNGDAVRTK